MNIEQEITSDLGAFLRAGWADGNIEPYEFTDVDRTVAGGVSLNGKRWGRPDDTIGIAGVINGITGVHQAFFNAGGLGILVGDGQLPHPGLEQIIEAYYSYALTAFGAVQRRLPVHRQSGLQHRSRPGECFCRPHPHRILIIIRQNVCTRRLQHDPRRQFCRISYWPPPYSYTWI